MADEAYQSLYRRFRPQRFAAVRGQDHVTVALRNAVRDDRVGHAYLFSGPRGTGKTTSARILAKALNCEQPTGGEPCDICESCVAITGGSSLDVQELDAASNNGIDAIRDLVSRVALATPGRWKVYIIDEVHMLSPAASNALLKTLEEPPRPRRVRAGHHRSAEGAADDPQPHAALRVPVAARRHADRAGPRRRRRGRAECRRERVARSSLGAAPARRATCSRRSTRPRRPAVSRPKRSIPPSRSSPRSRPATPARRSSRLPARLPPAATPVASAKRSSLVCASASSRCWHPTSTSTRATRRSKPTPRALGPAGVTRALEVIGDAVTSMKEAVDARVALETAIVRVARTDLDVAPSALLERIERLERGQAPVARNDGPPPADDARAALASVAPPPAATARPSLRMQTVGSDPKSPTSRPSSPPSEAERNRRPPDA